MKLSTWNNIFTEWVSFICTRKNWVPTRIQFCKISFLQSWQHRGIQKYKNQGVCCHLVHVHRLGEDPGLVFGLKLVQDNSEQNTKWSQLHLHEGLLQFNLQHIKECDNVTMWISQESCKTVVDVLLLHLPPPSLASLACEWVLAGVELSPGRVGGGATPSAAPLKSCFPPLSASEENI